MFYELGFLIVCRLCISDMMASTIERVEKRGKPDGFIFKFTPLAFSG